MQQMRKKCNDLRVTFSPCYLDFVQNSVGRASKNVQRKLFLTACVLVVIFPGVSSNYFFRDERLKIFGQKKGSECYCSSPIRAKSYSDLHIMEETYQDCKHNCSNCLG